MDWRGERVSQSNFRGGKLLGIFFSKFGQLSENRIFFLSVFLPPLPRKSISNYRCVDWQVTEIEAYNHCYDFSPVWKTIYHFAVAKWYNYHVEENFCCQKINFIYYLIIHICGLKKNERDYGFIYRSPAVRKRVGKVEIILMLPSLWCSCVWWLTFSI